MKSTTTYLLTSFLLALFTCSSERACAADPLSSPIDLDAVVLTGWLHVEDPDFDEATVQVEVNGEVLTAPVSKTGRFDILLPAETEVKLSFGHPGHRTKEVIVDTRNARDGDMGKRQRRVRFAVVLDAERYMAGQDGTPSVGSIDFQQETGEVALSNTRDLMVGRRNKLMVF